MTADYTATFFNETLVHDKTFCTEWRNKNTNLKLYLNLEETDLNGYKAIKTMVYGKKEDGSEHNCTYRLNEFHLEQGKKYEICNNVHENGCVQVQIRFEGKSSQTIKGRWSPDYIREPGCILVDGTAFPQGGPPPPSISNVN